jgi:F-type H+-transporting ATPase subunit b
MRIDWWTLAFQTVNVLVLLWLLSRLLFKPVSKIVTERQQAAAALMRDASTAREAAERDRKQASELTAALDAERLKRLGAITTEAEQIKTSLLATALTEADTIRASATSEIELMRKKAAQDDAAKATEFAIAIASRLLSRLPPSALVEAFIGPLASAVVELPNEVRRQLGGQSEPLHLIAPRPLDTDELSQCRAALADALGHETQLQIEVDPDLIAGLELVARHVVVRNSFRHDLDTLKAELLAHDDE